jgi:deazaflavin-dependent oxidoreductase (nitroreductase family)
MLKGPILVYRLGLGFVFGRRLLMLVHRGRQSGRLHRTVLEVAHYDAPAGEAVVITPWRAEWLKNIEAAPAQEIQIGRARFRPLQRFLSPDDVARVLDAYRLKGRLESAGLARLVGWRGDLSESDRVRIASRIVGVAFRRPVDHT